jgi:hypothetical protein
MLRRRIAVSAAMVAVLATVPVNAHDALAHEKKKNGKRHCTPGYRPCLHPASDYDCLGGSGDGPKYTGRVRVTGSDPYGLDSDNDGVGCE